MECAVDCNHQIEEKPGTMLSFPWGLPGLDDDAFLLTSFEPDSPFCFLNSVKQPEVGLLLVNPFYIDKLYEFELSDEVIVQLEITSEEQVAVLCTVNTSRGINSATVNLLAPLVINSEKRLAKQVVLSDKRYSLRTSLYTKAWDKEEES